MMSEKQRKQRRAKKFVMSKQASENCSTKCVRTDKKTKNLFCNTQQTRKAAAAAALISGEMKFVFFLLLSAHDRKGQNTLATIQKRKSFFLILIYSASFTRECSIESSPVSVNFSIG
jgi:hypothetical protein